MILLALYKIDQPLSFLPILSLRKPQHSPFIFEFFTVCRALFGVRALSRELRWTEAFPRSKSPMRLGIGSIFHPMLHFLCLQNVDRSRDVVCPLSLQNIELRVVSWFGIYLPSTVNCRLAVTSALLSLNLLLKSHLEVERSLSLRVKLVPLAIGTNHVRNIELCLAIHQSV